MEVGINDDLINILKYGYTNDPKNQMQYSQAADYLRGLTQSSLTPLQGADMPLPTGFNPQNLDFNQMMTAIEPYKDNPTVYKTLTDAIQKYVKTIQTGTTGETPAGEAPTEPTGATGEPTEGLDVFGVGSPYLSEEQLTAIGEAAGGEAGAGIDQQTEILTAVLGEYENVKAEMLTPEQILKMAQDAGALNFDTIIGGIETSFNSKKVSLENEKGEVNAAYAGAYDTIQRAIRASRMRSKADMNARGLFFSGVLSRSLAGIEEKGLELIGKTAGEKAAKLAAISNNIAVLTSNYEDTKLKAEGAKAAYIGLTYMNMLTDNKKDKQAINMIMAKLKGEMKGLEISKPSIMEAAKQKAMGIAQSDYMDNYIALANVRTAQYKAITTRIHNINIDDLEGKKFNEVVAKDSFYANLALNEFASDMLSKNRDYDLSASNLQLQWDKLSWDRQKYFLNIAKEKELAQLNGTIEGTWDKPLVDMNLTELQKLMNNLTPYYATITTYKKDKDGNMLDIDGNITNDLSKAVVTGLQQIPYYSGETVNADGTITGKNNAAREQYGEVMKEVSKKMKGGTQELTTILEMSPLEFHERLGKGTINNADKLSIPEQLVAYDIAQKYQFKFDNEGSVNAMKDLLTEDMNLDKSNNGKYTINWTAVMVMLFGSGVLYKGFTGGG